MTEGIDTATPGGRLVFPLFGALGRFERDLIRERTRAGLKAAETPGGGAAGRPRARVTGEKLRQARDPMAKGLTTREAAARIEVGKTALYKAMRSNPAPVRTQRGCDRLLDAEATTSRG